MTVGAYEAKTHFAELLDRVAKGESITITRHGVPVAKLVPLAEEPAKASLGETIEAFRRIRAETSLKGTSIRELIDEGRRY